MLDDRVNYISVRPGYLTTYSQALDRKCFTKRHIENRIHLKNNKQNGEISKKAEMRIKQAIDWLVYNSKVKSFYHHHKKRHFKFRLSFITLTLSAKQIHSDRVIKKELLNQFLIEARKRWKVYNYLWRAETQKNGNIHFHLTCDKFLPWWEVKNVWNRIQNKLHYVDRFHEKFPGRTPNSIDAKSIKHVHNIAAYLAKYCSKPARYRPIEGNLWGLSYSLSRIKASISVIYGEVRDEVEFLFSEFKDSVREFEFHSCMYVPVLEWSKICNGRLLQEFNTYGSSFTTLTRP